VTGVSWDQSSKQPLHEHAGPALSEWRVYTGAGPYLVTVGSVSKLTRLAPTPLPAGTKLGTHEKFEIALTTFEQILVAFPELVMTLDLHHPHVEYMPINLPVSVGLWEGGPRTAREIQS
jgi:hypothetical protein